jgi:RNA polymerase sigma-70 factor (ECF subfamily)
MRRQRLARSRVYCRKRPQIDVMPAHAQLMTAFDDAAPARDRAASGRLEPFLRGVERRALRMAEFATGDRDEALDLVQDAMLAFARNYGARPGAEWPPLFWRVVDSRLNDWHRRQRVRRSVWFRGAREDEHEDVLVAAPDAREPGPLARLADGEAAEALDAALRQLPLRQRQAFLLRLWEGLDVAATATAMRCSEGSVKTHLSRALANLRRALEPHR